MERRGWNWEVFTRQLQDSVIDWVTDWIGLGGERRAEDE